MQDPVSPSASQAAAGGGGLVLPAWLPQPLTDLFELFAAYPPLAAGLAIVLFLILGKIAELFLSRGVARLTAKTTTHLDDQILAYLRRPIFLTVLFAGLSTAARILSDVPSIERWTQGLLATILLLVWLSALFPALNLVLDALSHQQDTLPLVEERTIPFFVITGKLLLLGIASYLFLHIWDIDPGPWLASAGIVGIAVGFAAKDTLANLFAGLFILADAPYKIGDFIILDSGERGRVNKIGIRSTRLLTRDDVEITLPNAQIANAKIVNESGGPWEKERIRIKVGVAYGSDLERVCALLVEIAENEAEVCDDPTPRARFRTFGASGLDLELLCWIDEPVLRGKLSHSLSMAIYRRFNAEGVEIPYAKRDLYIKEMPT